MDNPEKPNDIAEEFRMLGENMVQALRSAWESPERKKLQDEIEAGLNQFATTIKRDDVSVFWIGGDDTLAFFKSGTHGIETFAANAWCDFHQIQWQAMR